MGERYVRPPLLGAERPSDRAAAWRFRIAFAILLAGIVVGVFFLYRALTASGEGSPGLNQGARSVVLTR